MVMVEKGKSGQWWRMEYQGEFDVLDHEPTEADKALFVQSVTRQHTRERFEAANAKLPAASSSCERVH